jgi:hypothetical protein
VQVFAIGAVVAAALAWVNTLNDSVKKAQQQADDLTPKVEKLPEALRQLTGQLESQLAATAAQLKSELAGTTEKLKENASSGGDASQWRTSVSLFG